MEMMNFINSSLENEFKQFFNKDISLKRNYYFLSLVVNDKEIKRVAEACNDVLGEIALCEINSKIVIFLYDDLDGEFKDVIQNLEYDLGIKIGAFKSGRLSKGKKENFNKYFEFYEKYLLNKKAITNMTNLILDMSSQDIYMLINNKDIFLNKIIENDELKKLIHALFENNLNITKTASDVYMHRNTINNKLEIIKEETGLNIQNFYDALVMYILLK